MCQELVVLRVPLDDGQHIRVKQTALLSESFDERQVTTYPFVFSQSFRHSPSEPNRFNRRAVEKVPMVDLHVLLRSCRRVAFLFLLC